MKKEFPNVDPPRITPGGIESFGGLNMKKEFPNVDVLVPSGDLVVIKADPPPRITPGGIELPDCALGKPRKGTVLAVGPAVSDFYSKGARVLMPISGGTPVILNEQTGNMEGVYVIPECELLGRVESKPMDQVERRP